ncbi:MAG: glycosyltransferase family 2 protein [Brachybacterium sp.]|nr:glycosyltransferase family 2 protein [Brachybacterium sp.]
MSAGHRGAPACIEGLGVIVPVHGPITAAHSLLRTLREPSPSAAPEIILVVDDASPVPVTAEDLPEGVELVRRKANGGFGAAVNTGLAELRARDCSHALVLNSDLEIPAELPARLVTDAAPWQPAVVGCRLVDEQGNSAYAARMFPTIGHQVIEWLVPLASLRHRDALHRAVGHDLTADRATGMVPVDWVVGAVLLLPITEVLDAGGFDEGYFMYTEEVDLQLRLHRAGIPSLLDADVHAVHPGGGSSGTEARRRRWLVGARMRYARQHGRPRMLRAAMTMATGANMVWNFGRRIAGRDVAPLAVAREELTLIHRAGRELRT